MIQAAFAPLASHLWQSTLFAAVAGLLTLALRRNQARVRYWLWVAASYKFLLPFSWLVSLGHQFEWRAAPAIMSTPFSVHLTDAVSGPLFLTSSPVAKVAPNRLPVLLFVMGAVWACGFVAVAARWVREWLRLRAIVRAASPSPLGLPIRVVSTPARLEPGVFGIFRPVLLLPDGIAGHLTEPQLRAIFAHELCHVRRRDNLTAAVHMLVEALFWFHPLVWWLGARMVDERELACDEEALQTGGQAQDYAESILKVCEFYLESPLTCVSGVTGSDLKKRIQRIMKEHFGAALSARKKWLLATAGAMALAVPFVVGMLRLQAQTPAVADWQAAAGGKMAFDVASVKANKSAERPTSNIPLTLDDAYTPTGGLFRAIGSQFYVYVRFAYKINGFPMGFPDWGRSERFDIEARKQGNPTKDQYRLMMQSLLADRFKLTTHKETRQIPIYALTVAKEGKFGPQFKQDNGPCSTSESDVQAVNSAPPLPQPSSSADSQPPKIPCGVLLMVPASLPGRVRVAGIKIPIALLTRILPNPASGLDRPVFDRTGLSGTFDMSIEWAPTLPPGAAPPGFTPDETGPTFTEALQDQLGLKLVPQTGPVDVLVIDHVEEPSEN